MTYKRPTSIEISDDEYLTAYRSVANAKEKLYNVGAGTWKHDFWTNIDLPPQTEAFAAVQSPCIHHDLNKHSALPISSSSVDAFYCSHVVEHLPDDTVLYLMEESYRCLNKGGVLRIVTGPCADLDWDALIRKDEDWWYWFKDTDLSKEDYKDQRLMTIHDQWLFSVATPRSPWSNSPSEIKYDNDEIIKMVEENKANPYVLLDKLTEGIKFDYSSPGNHISWWNYTKLKQFLERAGFSNVNRSAYGQSKCKFMRDLRYFDQTYPQISVYVEAVR